MEPSTELRIAIELDPDAILALGVILGYALAADTSDMPVSTAALTRCDAAFKAALDRARGSPLDLEAKRAHADRAEALAEHVFIADRVRELCEICGIPQEPDRADDARWLAVGELVMGVAQVVLARAIGLDPMLLAPTEEEIGEMLGDPARAGAAAAHLDRNVYAMIHLEQPDPPPPGMLLACCAAGHYSHMANNPAAAETPPCSLDIGGGPCRRPTRVLRINEQDQAACPEAHGAAIVIETLALSERFEARCAGCGMPLTMRETLALPPGKIRRWS